MGFDAVGQHEIGAGVDGLGVVEQVADGGRAELRRAASASLGEAAADTLMELVTPAGQDPATRSDIKGVLTAMSTMDERREQRSAAIPHRLTATFERGLREAITSQTRVLVVSLLVSVVAIVSVAFGLAG